MTRGMPQNRRDSKSNQALIVRPGPPVRITYNDGGLSLTADQFRGNGRYLGCNRFNGGFCWFVDGIWRAAVRGGAKCRGDPLRIRTVPCCSECPEARSVGSSHSRCSACAPGASFCCSRLLVRSQRQFEDDDGGSRL